MNSGSGSFPITSKVVGTYSKLFQGLTPKQIAPQEDPEQFFSHLLDLDVKREYLESELNRASKDACLGGLKPFLSALFRECVNHGHKAKYEDVKKSHALETLAILLRAVLAKNLTGWEAMEILAGGVAQSDAVFMAFTAMVNDLLADEAAPAGIRHQGLQAALIFVCGIEQLSPGAYFLRRDLFASIAIFIKSPDTEQFAFEAVLFLAILANFHKSDAAKLNRYLKSIKETRDKDLIRKICWASNFVLEASIKAYQEISDDSVRSSFSLSSLSIGSMIASLRPRALSLAPTDPPRELFKDQPIEATVILLPIFEFLRVNSSFPSVLLEQFTLGDTKSSRVSPLPFTILTLSSYLVTHASSTFSPRSVAYASLSLSILLGLAENDHIMKAFYQPSHTSIPLCRQRLPVLPIPHSQRPAICALLDCCVLWLRHNLHKRLEIQSYTNAIWVCYRIIWFLQKNKLRLEYTWKELWAALIGLLNFLSVKIDSLTTTGGVEHVVREAILLLDLSLCKAEIYLPSPNALHEFIYELIRSVAILRRQILLLESISLPHPDSNLRNLWGVNTPTDPLMNVLESVEYYEEKVRGAGAQTAKDALRVVAKEIETDGLYGAKPSRDVDAPWRSEDVLGFARYACGDGLLLMP